MLLLNRRRVSGGYNTDIASSVNIVSIVIMRGIINITITIIAIIGQ